MQYEPDYTTLLDLYIRLVQSQAGKGFGDGEAWKNDAQVLAIKLFRHLVSMKTLSTGATIEHNGLPTIFFVDHASVKVVARAALETYLVFFYIYGCQDELLSSFRHKIWHLGGLSDRQKFHTASQDGVRVKNEEKEIISALKKEIGLSPKIDAYPEKQKKKILDGEWRTGNSWTDLGVQAGFHKKYFDNIYGYLCGYSHSSYLSVLQTDQAKSIEDQQMLTQSILGIGVVIMAHFAFTYVRIFDTAAAILEADASIKRMAEKWRFGPDDMAEKYDRN